MQIHTDSFPSFSAQKFFGGSMIAGGAVLTAITAKTIIAVGFAAHLIPLIGNIVGIALMAIGSLVLFFACRKEKSVIEEAPNPLAERAQLIEEVEPEEIQPQEVVTEEGDAPVIEEKPAIHSPLDLTTGDKLIAGSNLVQWGLIGMSLYGIAPTITIPLNVLAGLGSDVITFCSLPKDASWLRKALSISTLSKVIVQYNPWVARFLQAGSLYCLANGSKNKAEALWEGVKTGGIKTLNQNKIHLFNLVSNVTFAAESVGLVNLRSQESLKESEMDASEVVLPPPFVPPEIASAPQVETSKVVLPPPFVPPEIVSAPQVEVPTAVLPPQVSKIETFVSGKCHGTDGKIIKCTSFWNNLQKAKEWLGESAKEMGEWRVFGEGSINKDEYAGQEASFIESGADSFIVRKDEKAKELVDEMWKLRSLAPFFKPVLSA